MSVLSRPFALISAMVTGFGYARRHELLFDLSDAELQRRGMDRDGLTRSYVLGLGHC